MGVPVDAMPFDPQTQDAFFVWCVRRRNALQAVLDGDLEKAVSACSFEWASFPPGRYGQPTTTIDKLRSVFLQYGGHLSNADLIQPPAQPEQPPETHMPLPVLALISAFGPMLAELLPFAAKAFSKDGDTPQKIEAATKIIQVVTQATAQPTLQGAIEAMQSSPEVLTTARNAVATDKEIQGLLELGGGIEKAREANLAVQNADKPFWYNPAFSFVMVAIVPPLYGVVGFLLWNMPKPSEQLVTQVVTGILGLAAVAGAYYLGSTQGSAQKTAIIANQASKQ
jgi:hypothetical protein